MLTYDTVINCGFLGDQDATVYYHIEEDCITLDDIEFHYVKVDDDLKDGLIESLYADGDFMIGMDIAEEERKIGYAE